MYAHLYEYIHAEFSVSLFEVATKALVVTVTAVATQNHITCAQFSSDSFRKRY